MDVNTIRTIFAKRPYVPLEIVVDNGDRHLLPHPESIIISDTMVVFVAPEEELNILDPAASSEVRRPPRRRKSASGRA